MISRCGFAIFVCGNREIAGKIEIGAGVISEFAIAAKMSKIPIPLAATGWAAEQILAEVMSNPARYYGTADVAEQLKILADQTKTDEEYIEAIFEIVRRCTG